MDPSASPSFVASERSESTSSGSASSKITVLTSEPSSSDGQAASRSGEACDWFITKQLYQFIWRRRRLRLLSSSANCCQEPCSLGIRIETGSAASDGVTWSDVYLKCRVMKLSISSVPNILVTLRACCNEGALFPRLRMPEVDG